MMAIKFLNNKRFIWMLKAFLILAFLSVTITHDGAAPGDIVGIQEPPTYNYSVNVSSDPPIIGPNEYSEIRVKITDEDDGTPGTGFNLSLGTPDGGNLDKYKGQTENGTFAAKFNSKKYGVYNVTVKVSLGSFWMYFSNYNFHGPNSTQIIVNEDPIAIFSVNQSNGVTPFTVYFNASDSRDIDGKIVSYLWDFGDGGKDNIGKMGTHTYQKAGEYTPSLTVNDNLGASNKYTYSSKISVKNPVNINPIAVFSVNLTNGVAPLAVNFDASSSSDVDGNIASYSWDFGDGEKENIGKMGIHTYQKAGEFTPSLTVTDNLGANSTFTSPTKIVVKNLPPASLVVSMSSDPAFIEPNKTSMITVSVISDRKVIPDANVSLSVDSGNIYQQSGTTNSSGSFTSIFTAPSKEGNYTVRALVTKNGFNDSSNETIVSVKPPKSTGIFDELLRIVRDNLPSIGGALLVLLVGVVIVISRNKKAPAPIPMPIATSLDIKIEPASIPADGIATATLTIKLKEKNGNLVASPDKRTLKIESDITCDIKSPQEIFSGQDTVTATITSKQVGIASIKVSLNLDKGEGSLQGEGKVEFTELAPKETGLDIKIDQGSVTADGKSTATLTITVLDEKGNSIASKNERTVQLSTDIGTLPITTVTVPSGEKSITAVISSEQIGAATVIAKSSSLKEATTKVNFVPNETGLDVQFKPPSIPADGKSTADVIIRIKDDKGNFIPSFEEKTIELSTSLGSITPTVKIPPQAQAGIATITSGEIKGTAIVKASVNLIGKEKSLSGEGKIVFEELSKRFCMHCGKTMSMEASKCPECGQIPPSGVDTKQCSTCEAVLPQSAKFCDSCGARQPM